MARCSSSVGTGAGDWSGRGGVSSKSRWKKLTVRAPTGCELFSCLGAMASARTVSVWRRDFPEAGSRSPARVPTEMEHHIHRTPASSSPLRSMTLPFLMTV